MNDLKARLRNAVKGIEQRDAQLADELQQVRLEKSNTLPEHNPDLEVYFEESHAPNVDSTVDINLDLETIVLRRGRPVLAVVDNTAELNFQDVESEVWKQRLTQARELLGHAIPAVGRIEVKNHPSVNWLGTGWLIAEDIIVTNRHVAHEFAGRRGETFFFRQGPAGPMSASIDFLVEHGREARNAFQFKRVLHIENEGSFDVAFLEVEQQGGTLAKPISLSATVARPEQQVAVIGYPARDSRIPEQGLMDSMFQNVYDKKRLSPGQILRVEGRHVLHDCSTLGGNSGAAVIDLDSGQALALHFAGRFLQANYAVPAATLSQLLQQVRGGTQRVAAFAPAAAPRSRPKPHREQPAASVPSLTSTAGTASLSYTIPIQLHIEVGAPVASTAAPPKVSARIAPPAAPSPEETEDEELITEGRAADYADREGYRLDFLGQGKDVPLPRVRNSRDVLTYALDGQQEQELRYQHFSVVMSKSRRLCFFSAVNIDGKQSRRMKRAPWRMDPRIPREQQILGECYGSPPKFSRGHMTRREDPIWGSVAAAQRGNEDSMHVTNTVPQMQPFNAPIWLGLENYALENARDDDMRISVFTGPFFRKDDPVLYGVRIPVSFWKVIAFVHDETGELCATGYTMSQEDFLQEEEFVFGQYASLKTQETFQVPISTIEGQAGLSFGGLSDVDPLGQAEESLPRPLRDPREIRFFLR